MRLKTGTGSLLLVIVTMVGLIMWLLLNPRPVGYDVETNTPITASVPSKTRAAVVVYCQDLVRQSLKAPSSASFPWATNVQVENDIYVMRSWVEAINAFNAKLRTPYLCRLRNVDNGDDEGWIVEQFEFLH